MMKASITVLILITINVYVSCQTVNPDPNCKCVPYYNCLRDNTINKYGATVIDIRLGETDKRQCTDIMDVCCSVPGINKNKVPVPPIPHMNKGCGYRNRNGTDFRITGDVNNLANEAEFPWMAIVFKKETKNNKQINAYKCGASLIHRRVVLTAAHCINNFIASDLVIRAGEWDTSSNKEILRHQDRKVSTIIKHPEATSDTLLYDFALLILETPFELADNVEVVCLPENNEEISSNECYVTGWGKNSYGENGLFSTVLKAIQLPTVPGKECEERLKKTRLGEDFELHPSLICAGGVPGFDSCEGDGGSPLVCPLQSDPNRYVQTGIVAWGIGCNNEFPAAYANVALVRSWIDQSLSKYNIKSDSYTA